MRWLVLVLLVACGAPHSEPFTPLRRKPPPPERPHPPAVVLRKIDTPAPFDVATLVPDPTYLARWPLSPSDHPKLEPSFDVAAQLAQPGVVWTDLCTRGIQLRRLPGDRQDLVQYLAAWCHIGNHELDKAIDAIYPLEHSRLAKVARAVRADLANMLVAEHVDIERVLARHGIDDNELRDRIAAIFVDMDQVPAALVVGSAAIAKSAYTSPAMRCNRIGRHVVLGEHDRMALFDGEQDFFCRRLHHVLDCWLHPATRCERYFRDEGIDVRFVFVMAMAYAWPTGPATYVAWLDAARAAIGGETFAHLDEHALTALDNARRTIPCTTSVVERVKQIAMQLRVRAELREELAEIVAQPGRYCVP